MDVQLGFSCDSHLKAKTKGVLIERFLIYLTKLYQPSLSFPDDLLLLLFLLLPPPPPHLLRWQYSPMRSFTSLMDFSESALSFDLFFHFLILHLLTCVCTQFHHLFFCLPLSRLSWGLLLNTLLLLSILLTWPIHSNRLTLTNESISKSPNSSINSLLYRFLQFSFTLIPPNIHLKTCLSKAASY